MAVAEPQPDLHSSIDSDEWPITAYVEMDRFCEECGYNLNTQPVRREVRTDLLVIRCPECGRINAAADTSTVRRPWLHRLALILLVCWIVVLVSSVVGATIGQGALCYLSLDGLTTWQEVVGKSGQRNLPFRSRYQRVVRTTPGFYVEDGLHALSSAGSAALGFIVAFFAVVGCYHWPKWRYHAFSIIWPILIALFILHIWRLEAPHLLSWGAGHIARHTACYAAGGIAGVVFGRPLARLTIRILLPARVRQTFAFLWLVDGKQLPFNTPAGVTSTRRSWVG